MLHVQAQFKALLMIKLWGVHNLFVNEGFRVSLQVG